MGLPIAEKVRKAATRAINDYSMLVDGDRILVAVSGGKDSSVLLVTLQELQKRAPLDFTITPVLLDQKQPGFSVEAYADWVRSRGLELVVIEEDTYSIVKEKTQPGKAYCGLCSRLRRGILYNYAHDHGFTKIALGHHRDDANETVLMNMFFSGAVASMPPKLLSDDKRCTVIRPLIYSAEADVGLYAKMLGVPIIPCNLCGSQTGLQRQRIKKLLHDLSEEDAGLGSRLLAAQANIKPSQMHDIALWDFNW